MLYPLQLPTGAYQTPKRPGVTAADLKICVLIKLCVLVQFYLGFPCGSDSKESACNAGDPGSVPGSGRFPGEGNGNSLQYSCLENLMDRGAWQATVHGVAKSWTRLRDFTRDN